MSGFGVYQELSGTAHRVPYTYREFVCRYTKMSVGDAVAADIARTAKELGRVSR
jgi:hypothetical protein